MVLTLAETATSIKALIAIFKDIGAALFGTVGDLATMVIDQPLLLIPVGIVFTYAGIKVFKMIF